MKIFADNGPCEANGLCAAVDLDLFPLDDDGYIDIGDGVEVPADKVDAAQRGVSICPKQALRIES